MDLSPHRSLLLELAQASGDFIRPLFGRPDLPVEAKGDQTPVTQADRGAEELMRRLIAARFPAHGILGEEHGPERTDAEFVWVLDPVDGTKSFITGVPLWTTLIALLHHGQPVLGCSHQPVLGQLVVGDGASTTLNGAPMGCRPTRRTKPRSVVVGAELDARAYARSAPARWPRAAACAARRRRAG